MQVPDFKVPNPNQGVIDQLKQLNEHVAAMRSKNELIVDLLRSINANLALNAKGGSSYGR